MNRDQIIGMLNLLNSYWSNFELTEARIAAWCEALRHYQREECWEAVVHYRSESGRVFAPTISELIGFMLDHRKDRQIALESRTELSKEPEYHDTMESYRYETTIMEKGKPTTVIKTALRCTRARRQQIAREQQSLGRVKDVVWLAGGRQGYLWKISSRGY